MKICVLGCGAYGSALATILSENKNSVYCYSVFKEEIDSLNETRIASTLPNVVLPNDIVFTNDLELASKNADFVLLAIPTAFVRSTLLKAKDYIKDKPIVIASKGIEQDTSLFVSEIISEVLKTDNIAVFSGPSFAIDVASKKTIGITLACQNKKTTDLVLKAFSNNHFKLRVCFDIIGTEICGAIKNIFAIGCGILEGMGQSESTMAMFITESAYDIKGFINDLGANGDTISSFAGFGDLLLTCSSKKSRNFSFGHLIGSGASRKEIDEYISNNTIEGLYTLKSIKKLIESKNIQLPIIDLIDGIINGNKKPNDLIDFLISK